MNKPAKALQGFIILVLIFFMGAPAAAAQVDVPARLHPLLSRLAAEKPDQALRVIVQKTDTSKDAERLLEKLGGRVVQDLPIIQAFSAEMKADQVPALAASHLVRWVSPDSAMNVMNWNDSYISPNNLQTAYIFAVNANRVWEQPGSHQGKGIGVAVIDSGINWQTDLYTPMGQNRVVANVRFNTDYNQTTFDNFGHGSHVAGIIGGNGRSSNGAYIGVAPQVNIINVKVSNDDGSSTASSAVAGLEWVLKHRDAYNIRVVNLSLNSATPESYHTSPIDAAVEVLWFNGIVVVASAGNYGSGGLYPPANDPFVITVGAVDDKGTSSQNDDVIPSFSAYGVTSDGFSKPDLVAPGKNIVSLLGNVNGLIPASHPGNKVGNGYFRMSGTSVAAPMVAGAAALLLEDEPSLTPDQVKYRLMSSAKKSWSGYIPEKAGAGYLNVYSAVNGSSRSSANTGTNASQLLWTGTEPVSWGSVSWNSVSWNSVSWNSVSWNSVSWNSVSWNSDYWGP